MSENHHFEVPRLPKPNHEHQHEAETDPEAFQREQEQKLKIAERALASLLALDAPK